MRLDPNGDGVIPSWAIAEAFRRLEVARLATEREREERARRWRERVSKLKASLVGTRGETR